MHVLLVVLVWVSIAYVTARFAEERGRSREVWFVMGILFGLFALAALFLLPSVTVKDKAHLAAVTPPPVPEAVPPGIEYDVEWYYLDQENNQRGPVEFEDLCVAWHDGVIKEDSYVWSEKMDDWVKVESNPDLMAALVGSTPNC